MTPDEIITKKDLEVFKQELFALLGKPKEEFRWLKNADLRGDAGFVEWDVADAQGKWEFGVQ